MYLQHFGLKRKPFSKTPDPAFLFPSKGHAEALSRLSFALEEREVAVLTGEVGTGKTTLSRALVDDFAERCRFALILNPALPAAQLLASVAQAFGVKERRRKVDTYAALAEHLGRLDAEGLFPVVVVDEAQLLPGRAAYDELRLLTNLAADDRAFVGLVLIGQPELRARLPAKGGEAFAQRVGVAYHLGPLEAAETGSYLVHRLKTAGREAPLFTPEAVELVHGRSGGIPRLVNQIANGALLEGFARDAREIGADVVKAAIEELDAWVGAGGANRVDS
ncbi:MAG TPA: AAA family ATPase [Anaeromyxobacteraceae bacterium]|nr:AAA family ATPase [Anaeromyxobacteraceae bacterium]